MKRVMHVIKKDIFRLKVPIVIWMGLVLLKTAYSLWGAHLLINMENFELQTILPIFDTLISYLQTIMIIIIIPLVVHEDPVTGSTAFWYTRPISRKTMLFSKALFIVSLFVILPLMFEVLTLIMNSVKMKYVLLAVPEILLESLSLVVPFFFLASMTPKFSRYALIGFSLVAVYYIGSTVIEIGAYFFETRFLSSLTRTLTLRLSRSVAVDVFIVLWGSFFIFLQYRTRKTSRTVAAFILGFFIMALIKYYWPWDFLKLKTPKKEQVVLLKDIDLKLMKDRIFVNDHFRREDDEERIKVINSEYDIRCSDLSCFAVIHKIHDAQIVLDDKTKLVSKTDLSGFYYSQKGAMGPLQSVLGDVKVLNPKGPDYSYTNLFSIDEDELMRHKEEKAQFIAQAEVYVYDYVVTSVLPLKPGAKDFYGAEQFVFFDVLEKRSEITVILVEKKANMVFEKKPESFSHFISDHMITKKLYVLRNPKRKEAIIPEYTSSFSDYYAFKGQRLVTDVERLRYSLFNNMRESIGVDKDWLKDAELVRVDAVFRGGCQKPLKIEDFFIPDEAWGRYVPREDYRQEKVKIDFETASIEEIIAVLESKDYQARSDAIEVLKTKDGSKDVEVIIQAFQDDSRKSIRSTLAYVLGAIGGDEAVQALILALKDTDAGIRASSAAALGLIRDKKAIEPLLQSLNDVNEDVRYKSIIALTSFKDSFLAEPLINSTKDSNPGVRIAAIRGLGELKEKKAVDALILSLHDSNIEIRDAAIYALGQIQDIRAEDSLIDMLQDPELRIVSRAIRALGSMKSKKAVESLIELLKHPEKDIRSAVISTLGNIKDPRAVEPLIEALKDPYAVNRSQAVWALAIMEDPRALEPLRELLQDPFENVRQSARNAINRLNEKTGGVQRQDIDFVIQRLKSPDPEMRISAARRLPNMKFYDPKLFEAACQALKDENPVVRRHAGIWFMFIRHPKSFEPMLEALQDPDWAVKVWAISVLKDLKDPRAIEHLEKLKDDPDERVQTCVLQALAELREDERDTDQIIGLLSHQDSMTRLSAVRALGQTKDERVVDLIIPMLRDNDWRVRMEAIYVLQSLKDERSYEAIKECIHDETPEVVNAVLNFMDQLKVEGFVDMTIQLLSHENPKVREFAAICATRIREERIIEPLMKLLSEPDVKVRRVVVSGLANHDDEHLTEPMLRLLDDEDEKIRLDALRFLKNRDKDIGPYFLKKALKDPSLEVRESAIKGLSNRTDMLILDDIKEALYDDSTSVRIAAIQILANLKDPAGVDELISLLGNQDIEVIKEAARALERTKDSKAVGPLMKLLSCTDPEVRVIAVRSLGYIGEEIALDALIERLEDNAVEVKIAAIDALGMLRNKKAVDFLVKILQDKDPEVRCRVISALQDISDTKALDALRLMANDEDSEVRKRAESAVKSIKSRNKIEDWREQQ
ncbi:MAG: HEAT repeat domain-containing protein [Candidatus Aureabacteria bacterium]|nr:HEAT repeat domain-containing protein [Candidatus Auribacterota bacterium]